MWNCSTPVQLFFFFVTHEKIVSSIIHEIQIFAPDFYKPPKKKFILFFRPLSIFCFVIKSHQHTSAFLLSYCCYCCRCARAGDITHEKKKRPWSFEALSRLSSPSSLILWSHVWLNFFFLQFLMMSFLYLRFVI
jgi:hypothetical protein